MDRASIGNLHQPCACGLGYVALDGDVAGYLADVAFLGLAIRTVLRVDPVVRETHGKSFGIDPLALGVESHCHGCTGTECGKKIVIRAWAGIVAANLNRLIRHQLMAPGPRPLQKSP